MVNEELTKINNEIEIDNELFDLEELMEARQLLEEAEKHGEAYGTGFLDGFFVGRELRAKFLRKSCDNISEKHESLYNSLERR